MSDGLIAGQIGETILYDIVNVDGLFNVRENYLSIRRVDLSTDDPVGSLEADIVKSETILILLVRVLKLQLACKTLHIVQSNFLYLAKCKS